MIRRWLNNSRYRRQTFFQDAAGWLNASESPSGSFRAEDLLSISTVFAAVRNISEDVGKLPLILYQPLGRGRNRAVENPLYYLLHDRPNPRMSRMDAISAVTSNALLFGNGYCEIERDGSRVRALWPRYYAHVRPIDGDGGGLDYVISEPGRDSRVVAGADMIHIRGFSTTGVVGEMVARLGSESFGVAISIEKFASGFFQYGATPTGVLKHPGELTSAVHSRLREDFLARARSGQSHAPIILEEGMTWEQISVDPETSQMVEAAQFRVEEVCRWFRIPPHKVGHLLRAVGWSTLEATNLDYYTDTLLGWTTRWELELGHKLLTGPDANLNIEFLYQGLLRGDHESRSKFYSALFDRGVLTANQIAELENLPLGGPESDARYVMSSLRPVGGDSGDAVSTALRVAADALRDWAQFELDAAVSRAGGDAQVARERVEAAIAAYKNKLLAAAAAIGGRASKNIFDTGILSEIEIYVEKCRSAVLDSIQRGCDPRIPELGWFCDGTLL